MIFFKLSAVSGKERPCANAHPNLLAVKYQLESAPSHWELNNGFFLDIRKWEFWE